MNKEKVLELAHQAGFIGESMYPIIGTCQQTALQNFAELIVRECGYYADVFEAVGCPVDMDHTETKPSDYIKKQLGIDDE